MCKYRRLKGVYVNTSHHGVGHIDAYYVFKAVGQISIVFYLHDIIPIDYPEYVREGDDKNHIVRVTAMANYADSILVNSDYTRDRFYNFCDNNGLRKPEVSVAYIGVEDSFINLMHLVDNNDTPAIKIPGNYFVAVSTIEPRKNHLLLLQIWRDFIEKGETDIPKLVIIGKRGWNIEFVTDFLDRSPSLKEYVIEVSGLSDLQLMKLMRNSKGMLFPSFVEGWGMPIVEALALNIPVICSDIQAFRESGQGLAKYISPIDSTSWQKEIVRISRSAEYHKSLVDNSGRAELPRWKEHFLVIETLLDGLNYEKINITPKRLKNTKKLFKESLVKNNRSDDYKSFKKYQERTAFQRKIQKLKNNPQSFFDDSSSFLFRLIGRFLSKY